MYTSCWALPFRVFVFFFFLFGRGVKDFIAFLLFVRLVFADRLRMQHKVGNVLLMVVRRLWYVYCLGNVARGIEWSEQVVVGDAGKWCDFVLFKYSSSSKFGVTKVRLEIGLLMRQKQWNGAQFEELMWKSLLTQFQIYIQSLHFNVIIALEKRWPLVNIFNGLFVRI